MDRDDKQGDVGLTNRSVQVEYAKALENARTGNSVHSSATGNSSASGANPSGATPGSAAPIIGAAGTPSTGSGGGSNNNPPPPAGGGSGGNGGSGKKEPLFDRSEIRLGIGIVIVVSLLFIWDHFTVNYIKSQAELSKNLNDEEIRRVRIQRENAEDVSQKSEKKQQSVPNPANIEKRSSTPQKEVVETKKETQVNMNGFSCRTTTELENGFATATAIKIGSHSSLQVRNGCALIEIDKEVTSITVSGGYQFEVPDTTKGAGYFYRCGVITEINSVQDCILFLNKHKEEGRNKVRVVLKDNSYVHFN